jgi:hypothetical protein
MEKKSITRRDFIKMATGGRHCASCLRPRRSSSKTVEVPVEKIAEETQLVEKEGKGSGGHRHAASHHASEPVVMDVWGILILDLVALKD